MTTTRRRMLLGCGLLLLLVVLVPLFHANQARQQAAWESGCRSSGGSVWSAPAPRDNPLVVQLGRPTYECRSVTGVLVSVRD